MFRIVVVATPQSISASPAFGSFDFSTEKAASAVSRWLMRWPGVQVICVYDGVSSKRFTPGEQLHANESTESPPWIA